MEFIIFLLVAFIVIFIIAYRNNNGENVYKLQNKLAYYMINMHHILIKK